MLDGSGAIPPGGGKPEKPLEPNGMRPIDKNKPAPIDENKPSPLRPGTKRFLGMNFTQQEYAKFLSNILNTMMSQIKSENERMLKAIRKLRDND